MRSFLFLLFIVFFTNFSHAQDKTYSYGKMGYSQTLPKVAIVPFESNLYLSDINKEIGNRTGLTMEEIENTFRDGIIQTLISLGSDSYNFIDPTEMEDEELHRIIGGFYSCISYDYTQVVPIKEADKTRAQKLVEKLENKENPNQKNRGAYLEDGQIKEWYDHKERYMDAKIHSQEKFDELILENDLDFILLITELDIKVMRDVNRDVGQVWPRRVKIHFTIFDSKGNKTFGSAVYNTYNGDQKDIYSIIRKNFRAPCAQIITKLGTSDDSNLENTNRVTHLPKEEKKEKIKRVKLSKTNESGNSDDDF